MAEELADRRDIAFVLKEQLRIGDLSRHDRFADYNEKVVDLILKEARTLAVKEILPTRKDGDADGCVLENGKVRVPESFHRAWDLLKKGEWPAASETPEWGGQGMPRILAQACGEYFNGANIGFMMYAGLTLGAGMLVKAFGTKTQKRLFLKNMFTGKWTGTMLLTEPDAGSDVGALATRAVLNDDGTYSITGEKIFISSGEHDLAENIIHPVLARIDGAPAGTDGISLFLVPKIRVNDDGSLGKANDVVCSGMEEKMGIHGNATCTLVLGGKGNCRGTLLGEENKGMRAMFLMMNEARLLVGLQGFACASASYINAVNYAGNRKQGRHLSKIRDKTAPSVSIIKHPDVRRMLLVMKSGVEGMRSLLCYIAHCMDLETVSNDPDEKLRYQGIIDLLVPIAKGYVTDLAYKICNMGLQVYGGYGYIREYPQEQLVRDCRITMIYEGTNGIQAMDLLGRKLGLKGGKPIMNLMDEIQKTMAEAKSIDALAPFSESLGKALALLQKTARKIGFDAMGINLMTAFAHAYPFMEVCGDVVMAWMLLWRAQIAAGKLAEKTKKKDIPFYEGQVKSAEFFIRTQLPVTRGKMNAILDGCDAAVTIPEKAFGG